MTAFCVFMALQLAVGLGFAGLNWHLALIWPYKFLASSSARLIAVFALLGFAGVALYVYRLKLVAVVQRGERIRRLEKELEVSRAQQEAARKDAEARLAAAKEALRDAIEERKHAERRVADAQARMRAGAQSTRAGGNDDGRFTEARRVFARLYHPDNVRSSGIDKAVRQEIFKEYWGDLDRIQKGGKG